MDAAAVFWNYKIPILLGGISVLAIVRSIVLLVKSTQTTEPIRFSSEEASASALDAAASRWMLRVRSFIRAFIPCRLVGGVEGAITAVGGLGSDVDEEVFAKMINRAAKITDGAKLYISEIGVD